MIVSHNLIRQYKAVALQGATVKFVKNNGVL